MVTTIFDAGSLRQALRNATADDHHRVDALYGRFALDQESNYRAFLRAHARALGALEPASDATLPRLLLLHADLAALGEDAPPPLPLAIEPGDAWRWGLRYALEGSRLGGAMLARRVDPALPHSYLSAAHEKGGWVAFQQDMADAAQAGGDAWMEGAIAGARAAFAIFAQAGQAEAESVPHHG